jgi:hypothetical protein
MAAWVRLLVIVATTLASSTLPPAHQHDTCALMGSLHVACAAADAGVLPHHAIMPLLVAFAVVFWAHLPTLVLRSKHRSYRLSLAAARAASIWLAVLGVYAVHDMLSPSLAYASSLHLAITFLSPRPCDTLLLVPSIPLAAVRYTAMAALVAGAFWGPPLPVLDAPGAPACCGAACHLAGWILAEVVAGTTLAVLLDSWNLPWP